MSTKNNPGKYDAYHKADPNEPIFTLLGRDPQGAHLVSIWSKLRVGDKEAAAVVFQHLLEKLPDYPRPDTDDDDKSSEAMQCSLAMFEWFHGRL